jgi:hypothetical protein
MLPKKLAMRIRVDKDSTGLLCAIIDYKAADDITDLNLQNVHENCRQNHHSC